MKAPRLAPRHRAATSLLAFALLAAGHSVAIAAATPADSLNGRWATPSGGVVELGTCVEEVRDVTVCGHIVALGGLDDRGRQDVRNPNPTLRARSVVGLKILNGLHHTATGVWAAGDLYNPDDGHTYRGAVRLLGDDRLVLKGCALAVLCQKQVWRRVP